MSNARKYAGVSQKHRPCSCGQAHTSGCVRREDEGAASRCRCSRSHSDRCPHRVYSDGKTRCTCTWVWVAEVQRAGKRYQRTGTASSMTAAAKARAAELDSLARTPKAAKTGGSTIDQFMRQWLTARSEGTKPLRPSTKADYERYLAYIEAAIGRTRLRDVDASTLDEFLKWMRRTKKGETATVRGYAILQAAIRWGYRRGMLPTDPTATYDARPEVASKRRPSLSPSQFLRLYEWAQNSGDRFAPWLWVAVMTGARRGELCALRWVDVDTERACIVVQDNAVQVGRKIVVGKVKTAAGEGRRIPLDSETVTVLRSIQARQASDTEAWGSNYENGAMLVFTRENGRALMPETLTKGLPRLIRRFNAEREIHTLSDDSPELARLARHKGMGAQRLARIRSDASLTGAPLPVVAWHSLRHLSASIHLASGDVFSVSRRLGHANVSTTTTIYGHEIKSIQHAQTEAAARALRGQFQTHP